MSKAGSSRYAHLGILPKYRYRPGHRAPLSRPLKLARKLGNAASAASVVVAPPSVTTVTVATPECGWVGNPPPVAMARRVGRLKLRPMRIDRRGYWNRHATVSFLTPIQLLSRTPRGSALTEAGATFREHGIRALAELELAQEAISPPISKPT
ncbi:hypothetical protein CBM2589_A70453 [Cupriavidus taiwanensis]|uniref:Uncharacterized protein n=1 Tax=Cupriavidus taiwanensis TaxID=164546 RepID=A0A975XB59_9BURK|nr:hypothetical protein CBM2589_A70453 [Cupriavidus taiwanensis]